jgi:hypothetical protein
MKLISLAGTLPISMVLSHNFCDTSNFCVFKNSEMKMPLYASVGVEPGFRGLQNNNCPTYSTVSSAAFGSTTAQTPSLQDQFVPFVIVVVCWRILVKLIQYFLCTVAICFYPRTHLSVST